MTFTDSTDPARPNRSCSSLSPTSYGRFPTYSFRPMCINSSVAIATLPTSNDVGGCRLVARLNFRRASQKWLDTPEAGTVRGKIRNLRITRVAQHGFVGDCPDLAQSRQLDDDAQSS